MNSFVVKQLQTVEECTSIGSADELSGSESGTPNPFMAALDQLCRERGRQVEEVPPEPESPTLEQRQICLTACAPSDAHLSDFDDNGEEDSEEDVQLAAERRRKSYFPYSSGSSPVSSFRQAIRQSRAPSQCGKFNESLLAGMGDKNAVKSSLCVCTSIRNKATTPNDEQIEGEELEKQRQKFPLKTHPVTNEYKISHEIVGIGESGKVMACFHRRRGEKCALKVLRDTPRSRREVELQWLAAQHANVVSIGDIFENSFDGLRCLLVVVEFMEGGDLLTIFEANDRTPYSEKCVGRIVSQIGSAVQFLHERNIAHRDIKLENILCSSPRVNLCTFKLADFGFAKRAALSERMNSPCCTPAYVCPEILSQKQYDKSCDIWALGVATYILLCGYPPFYAYSGLPFSPGMRERIKMGLFVFPAEDWDGISASTKSTIEAMLKTDPCERISVQQLMASGLISANKPLGGIALPPVNSDSSLSDGGFESSAAQSSSAESERETHNGTAAGARELSATGQKRRAHFFVGSGAKSSLNISPGKGSSFRARVHSIQEEVSQALALIRTGGDHCSLKDPKTVRGNSLLERRRANRRKRSDEQ